MSESPGPLLDDLMAALERASSKSQPLLQDPSQVESEQGRDLLDVIAHQYFDLDSEQILLICEQSLPALIAAVRALRQSQ
jgi:uncharacterized protein with HEPN domain